MASAQSAIDLARELVREFERSTAGTVTVIPVLVDDLAFAMPALRAFSELTGALWLDSSDLSDPVPPTSDVLRAAAWRAGLQIDAMGSPRSVQLQRTDSGLIDAVFDPPTGGGPSPGEATILGLARAAAHGDLDEASAGIILYRDSVLDLPTRRAAWKASVEWFFDVPHPALQVLVVVVESSIDVGLHCTTGLGFRYALADDRLLVRRGRDDLRASVRAIATVPDPMVIFLGAGFSASSRLPLGNYLRDTAICRLLGIDDQDAFSSHDLAVRFFGWVSGRRELMSSSERMMTESDYVETLTLEQVVRAEVGFFQKSRTLEDFLEHHERVVDSPGPCVLDLAKILEEAQPTNRMILCGVNFDQLIERNCGRSIRVFASDSEFEAAPDYLARYLDGRENDVPYLKFHGSIDDLDTCVASAEQTELGIGSAKLAALHSLLSAPPRMWIYVGASMRDLDLLPAQFGEDFSRGTDERWVSPYMVDTVEAFGKQRQPFWKNGSFPTVQDRLIAETADAFFAALREELVP